MARIVVISILMFLLSGFIMGSIMFTYYWWLKRISDPSYLMTGLIPTDKLISFHSKQYYFWLWLAGTLFLSILMLIAFLF
jgi:hypothetical protein